MKMATSFFLRSEHSTKIPETRMKEKSEKYVFTKKIMIVYSQKFYFPKKHSHCTNKKTLFIEICHLGGC